ncbi:MAG: multidrug effflux MFS transporter [Gammaproteobacteria bacterium]|nr:multidrug effflux MFS transporter [Gammaproteobacteria bacterium]
MRLCAAARDEFNLKSAALGALQSVDRELLKMALILGLVSMIGPFAIDMYLPAMPAIAADFNTSASVAQLTLTSYFVAFAVAQMVFGPASDVFGRKKPIYVGMTLFILASVACVLSHTIEMLIAVRFLQGFGAAGIMSIPRAVIRDRYTGVKATRLMSTVMLVFSVSPMLAPLAGSMIIVPFGWRAVFAVVAGAAALALVLNIFALPETLPQHQRSPFQLSIMLTNFGILLKDRLFIGLTLIGGLGMASFFVFLGSASFVYMEYYKLSPTQFSLAFAVNAAGFFIASQFSANLLGRLGPTRLIRYTVFGFALTTTTLLLAFVTGWGSLPLMILLLVMGNLFLGFMMPTANVLALEEHGPIAGAAASLGGTMQMVTGVVAMALGSAVFDGSPLPMLMIIAACGVITLALALLTVRDRPAAA